MCLFWKPVLWLYLALHWPIRSVLAYPCPPEACNPSNCDGDCGPRCDPDHGCSANDYKGPLHFQCPNVLLINYFGVIQTMHWSCHRSAKYLPLPEGGGVKSPFRAVGIQFGLQGGDKIWSEGGKGDWQFYRSQIDHFLNKNGQNFPIFSLIYYYKLPKSRRNGIFGIFYSKFTFC